MTWDQLSLRGRTAPIFYALTGRIDPLQLPGVTAYVNSPGYAQTPAPDANVVFTVPSP
jgi:hypothetical protein